MFISYQTQSEADFFHLQNSHFHDKRKKYKIRVGVIHLLQEGRHEKKKAVEYLLMRCIPVFYSGCLVRACVGNRTDQML